ncbi:Sugar transporter [Operophtera brumata]|uniref:Sugar transporter n=1 Tax=Operophtera brumata TaxID=104452 RepID=A0A0L7KWB8_OPEBR|nr:Sugar transporter [Operophtera brumata]
MDLLTVFRQVFVMMSPQLAGISIGGAVTYPTVLLNQLRGADSNIQLNMDTASWLGSIQGLAGIPSILMPGLMQWKGRKIAFMTGCLTTIIGWFVAYTATSATGLLISESFHGLGGNSILPVSLLTISEMVDPLYRNVSMQTFAICQALGITLVVVMSRYLHWRTISIVMCVPMILALSFASFWPESPSWLAYKGEFDKCEKAFKWLRGTNARAQKELADLVAAQKESIARDRNQMRKSPFMHSLRQLTNRDFFIPILHMLLLLNLTYWSGGLVVIVYSIDIIQRATGDANFAFYGGVMINCILLFGVTISMILVKKFSNKSVLLFSAAGDIFFLACASLVTYLQSIEKLPRDSLLCMYCMIGFMVTSSLGLHPIPYDMAAEVVPVKYRGAGGIMYVIIMSLLHTSSLKLYPYLVVQLDLCGTFLIYMTNAIVCALLIWKYVPETKQKTLQQIEDYYMFGEFDRKRILEADDTDDTPMIDYS